MLKHTTSSSVNLFIIISKAYRLLFLVVTYGILVHCKTSLIECVVYVCGVCMCGVCMCVCVWCMCVVYVCVWCMCVVYVCVVYVCGVCVCGVCVWCVCVWCMCVCVCRCSQNWSLCTCFCNVSKLASVSIIKYTQCHSCHTHTHRGATCFPGRIPVKTQDGSLLLRMLVTIASDHFSIVINRFINEGNKHILPTKMMWVYIYICLWLELTQRSQVILQLNYIRTWHG